MAASARALTRNRRIKAKQHLIELAAQHLVNWKVTTANWADNGRQKDRLARVLSQEMERNPNLQTNGPKVKANWVTWHRREIEQKRVQIKKDRKT
jgi:threonine aldolase